jgi:hypothetical protein
MSMTMPRKVLLTQEPVSILAEAQTGSRAVRA